MNKLKDYFSGDKRFLVGIDANVYADRIQSGEGAKSLPERTRSELGANLKEYLEVDWDDPAVIELTMVDQSLLQVAYAKQCILNE